MKVWLILLFSIIFEVFATTMLKASDGLTRLLPSIGVFVGYGLSFYGLSIVLRSIPVGMAYAIWSGLGIVLASLAGWLLFKQKLDGMTVLGMVLIISGVVVMNLLSTNQSH